LFRLTAIWIHVFVTANETHTLVIVVHESTLNRNVLPDGIALVHVVKVVSWLLVAVAIVGGVALVMLSASVGGYAA
jgi:hypothetical protein